jgi:GGDEF domain-containing protein
LSVLEAYSAMTHERPHRPPRSSDEACAELIDNAGTQFDPEVVQILVERTRQRPPGDEPPGELLESLPLDRRNGDDRALDAIQTSTLDGLRLLGDHRALQRAVRDTANDATSARRFAVVLLQLQELPRINQELGYVAGDRLIEVAARRTATAATRLGAMACRASGCRLAIQVPLREDDNLGDILENIRSEFVGGTVVEVVASAWKRGDRGEDVVARARRALKSTPI